MAGLALPTSGTGGGYSGTFGALAEGISGFLRGMVQGEQLKQQRMMMDQQIINERLQNSLTVFNTLSKIGQSSPQALRSPEIQQYLKQQSQSGALGGVPLPTDQQGNIDVAAFMPPPSSLTDNPTAAQAFFEQAPGSVYRQTALSGIGGSDEQRAGLLNAPQIPRQSDIDATETNYRQYLNMISMGADPKSLIDQINGLADTQAGQYLKLPKYQIDKDGKMVPASGQGSALGASSRTDAIVKSADASAGLHRSQQTAQDIKNKYLDKMQQLTLADKQESLQLKGSQIALNSLRLKLLPAQTQASITRANAAYISADASSKRVAIAMADVRKLGMGMSPAAVQAYTRLESVTNTHISTIGKAAQAAQNALNTFLTGQGGSPPVNPYMKDPTTGKTVLQPGMKIEDAELYNVWKQLDDSATHYRQQYNTAVGLHAQVVNAQNAVRTERLRNGGGTNSMSAPPQDPKVSTALQMIKSAGLSGQAALNAVNAVRNDSTSTLKLSSTQWNAVIKYLQSHGGNP